MKRILFLLSTILLSNFVFAQVVIGDNRSEGDSSSSKLEISGFVDSYYLYNLNKPGINGNWATTGYGRVFDGEHNQIALNMIQGKIDYSTNNFGFVGDFVFGPGAEIANYGDQGTTKSIKQAYGEYKTDKMTFTIGKFSTHVGYEVFDAPVNVNYSLSYLFAYGPYYHTGVKINYQLADDIAIMIGVLNGWDAVKDNNQGKTIAVQIAYEPSDDLWVYVNYIGGNEESGDSTISFKQLIDLSAGYDVSKKFNIGLNAAFGFYNLEDNMAKNWGGSAIYLKYALAENDALAIRAEVFDDTQGVQGLGDFYTGYTLTYLKSIGNDHLYLKPEIRYDQVNGDIYYEGSNSLSNSQLTVGMAVVAYF